MYKAISSFQINFGGIEVTCVGSQFPLFLCIDIAVFTLCLSAICSDFQLFSDAFSNILSYWSADFALPDDPFFGSKFRDSVASSCSSLISYLLPGNPCRRTWDFPCYAALTMLWVITFTFVAVCLVVFDAVVNVLGAIESFFRFTFHQFITSCRKLVGFVLSFTPLQR